MSDFVETFTLSDEDSLPRIVLGGMGFATPFTDRLSTDGWETALECIREVLKRTTETLFIDLARIYGNAEHVVAKALKCLKKKEKERIHIITKVGITGAKPESFYGKTTRLFMSPDEKNNNYYSNDKIVAEIEDALALFDGVKVSILLHRIDPRLLQDEMIEIVQKITAFKDDGKIAGWGVSEIILADLKILIEKGLKPDYVESEFSLLIKHNYSVWLHCVKKGITFLAYSVLARGFLTDKGKAYPWPVLAFQEPYIKRSEQIQEFATEIAKECEVSLERVASAFVQDFTVPIIGTKTPERFLLHCDKSPLNRNQFHQLNGRWNICAVPVALPIEEEK